MPGASCNALVNHTFSKLCLSKSNIAFRGEVAWPFYIGLPWFSPLFDRFDDDEIAHVYHNTLEGLFQDDVVCDVVLCNVLGPYEMVTSVAHVIVSKLFWTQVSLLLAEVASIIV